MGEYTITTLGPSTGFLELPFGEPLEQWTDPRIVHVPRGISRHIVRFIRIDGSVYAIKQGTEHFVLPRASTAPRPRHPQRSGRGGGRDRDTQAGTG